MGVYLHYQAMPETSRLCQRLRTEQPLCVMYAELIHRPAGPDDTARLSPTERDDLLTGIGRNAIFGSRAAADRVYADLRAELVRAANEFPGLPQRAAYLKMHDDFDNYLARALAPARADAGALADQLIMGAGPFAPDGFGTIDLQLQLVPPALVAEAAELFLGVSPARFPGSEPEWAALRSVYVEAAAGAKRSSSPDGNRADTHGFHSGPNVRNRRPDARRDSPSRQRRRIRTRRPRCRP